MFPFNISEMKIGQWSALTIQGIIISINAILFFKDILNNYLLISSIVILSLFMLQAINHRFLLLNPVNMFMKKFVPSGDTYLLKFLIILSIIFLFFGVGQVLEYFQFNLANLAVMISGIFFLILLPLFWFVCGYKLVRNSIVKKLKKGPYVFKGNCPICNQYAEISHEVRDWNKGYEKVKCYGRCAQYESSEKWLNLKI